MRYDEQPADEPAGTPGRWPTVGAGDALGEVLATAAEAMKPRLRGWLHAATFPLSVTLGILLVTQADGRTARVATAVYAVSAAVLFGVSAVYHRGTWSARTHRVLKRIDHSNIFLIIAATYTPFALLLLEPARARVLLSLVWSAAVAGVVFRMLWDGAPRWLYTPAYIAMGWAAVFFLPDFLRRGGLAVVVLLVAGGLLYSLGGLVYATRRPDPSPRWFGYHEVFHAFTLAAYGLHYVALALTAD